MSDISNLAKLRPDELFEMVLLLPDLTLINLCKSNRYLNRMLCENNIFWMNKVSRKHGVKILRNKPNNQTWKEYYIYLNTYGHIAVVGENFLGVFKTKEEALDVVIENIKHCHDFQRFNEKAAQVYTAKTGKPFIDEGYEGLRELILNSSIYEGNVEIHVDKVRMGVEPDLSDYESDYMGQDDLEEIQKAVKDRRYFRMEGNIRRCGIFLESFLGWRHFQ